MQPYRSHTGLRIHTSYHWISFALAMFKPKATINGHPVPPLRWGENHIPLPPGVYRLRIWVQYLWPLGPAEITFDNRHGQTPPVYYGGTAVPFIDGAIDHRPVEPPGTMIAILLNAIPLIILPLCCLGGLFVVALGGGD